MCWVDPALFMLIYKLLLWIHNIFNENFSVLQFELRKAHDTIKSLRGSLTVATEQEVPQNTQKDPSETSSLNEVIRK